jgi:hypothetical protein
MRDASGVLLIAYVILFKSASDVPYMKLVNLVIYFGNNCDII